MVMNPGDLVKCAPVAMWGNSGGDDGVVGMTDWESVYVLLEEGPVEVLLLGMGGLIGWVPKGCICETW